MISDYWAKPPGEFKDLDDIAEELWLRKVEDQAASPLLGWLNGQLAREEFVMPGGSRRFAAEVDLKKHLLKDHSLRIDVRIDSEEDDLVVHRNCSCQGEDGVVRGEWPCETVRKTAAVYADEGGYFEALVAEEELIIAVHSTWYWKKENEGR